jgi:hypothetical protein
LFIGMIYNTDLVFAQARELSRTVTLLWSFRLPWHWALAEGAAAPGPPSSPSLLQHYADLHADRLVFWCFSGRSWCVICPKGTMTQLISWRSAWGGKRRIARRNTCAQQ